ncbi:MAG TPA: DNA methyltransferase [Candidatus Acidoferrum sp.]|nr:DNA methyltransferase [Candidatus Acidoferrum sp.]
MKTALTILQDVKLGTNKTITYAFLSVEVESGNSMVPDAVVDLVEAFERNLDSYRSVLYKEAQVRREFIDPFFEALGWDVQNRRKYAENYKEVVHEPSLESEFSNGAPDYSFQPGGRLKFYVEAKKPSVNLDRDPEPAHQIRMYGWTKQLPICMLSNFAEFAVYDCRFEPRSTDAPPVARLLYLTFRSYLERWDELISLFSPEAVFKGSFDRWAETRRRRGGAPFDERFLVDMEDWRKRLAENIALRNPHLSQQDLNYAVQQTIDRIIFLRICEARGIERFGRLRDLAQGGGIYASLAQYFRLADDVYNSGLFHFRAEAGREAADELTPGLRVDDAVLKHVIRHLYWPTRPYAFEVVPADILGQVYERFLGKVIYLTSGHRANVKDKPEVKKAGGVFYTPTYIVDYIVKQTLGRLLDGKSLRQAANLHILDPACGSGSFLLGAFEYLLNWYRDKYVEDGAEKHRKRLYQTPAGWRLTIAEKKQILLNNIFGVDIDQQAVEVTKLSLLLKVLEGESEQTVKPRLIREPALPDLDRNIKCGNSLIGLDFDTSLLSLRFSEEDRRRANSFSWQSFPSVPEGRFDAVIGNPPYDVLEKDRRRASWPHEILAEYAQTSAELVPAFGGKLNLFRFFVVKSLLLCRPGGRFGMIVPLALLADISCANTRRHLISSCRDFEADCFPQKDNPNKRVFKKAKLSTVVLTCTNSGAVTQGDPSIHIRTYPANLFTDAHKESTFRLSDALLIDPENCPIPMVDQASLEVCLRICRAEGIVPLRNVPDFEVNRGEINQTIFRRYIDDDPQHRRLVKGVEIGRYRENKKLSQGKREWFDEAAYLRRHEPRDIIHSRRIATQRITGVDEKLRVVATIIDPPAYFADSTNSIVARNGTHPLEYLLALLNSRLFQWRFKLTSTNNNVGTNEIDAMPFRLISEAQAEDVARRDQLVEFVERMLAARSRPTPRNPLEQTRSKNTIEALDRRIEALIRELYSLTEEEIAVIEGRGEFPASRGV